MSEFAALALYPSWALAVLVGLTALRLGRTTGRGLVSLCLCLAFWITGLVMLRSPGYVALGERVLPSGMLLAGAFVHAGADVLGIAKRGIVILGYLGGVAVALLGAIAPRLLYGPGAHGPGPLFVPLAILSVLGTASVLVWLAWNARAATGGERRRRLALTIGCALGAVGGGGAIGARVLGIVDVDVAAPLLLIAVLLAGYGVLRSEYGRARRIFVQAMAYSVVTAALSSVGLVLFFHLLPWLAPGGGKSIGWLVFVTFFAALPLDVARLVVVERIGRALFRRPIGVRDLAVELDQAETRVEHVARLAEIGTLASAVAHEIRNPLGIIAAHAKVLERAGANPSSVAALRAQVDRARRFLDDLLRYSKPRPLELREVMVAEVVAASVRGVRDALGANDEARAGAADRDGSGLPEFDVSISESISIEADQAALADVMTALLHNAAAALDGRAAGGPSPTVAVRARVEGADVILTVEDNGPGVPPEIEQQIFEPFVTGRGRDARHPGTGLGLAIAARWVERHGGAIRHERPSGGGARFVVRWPRDGARGG